MSTYRVSRATRADDQGGGEKSSSPNPSPSSWNAVSRGRSRTRNPAKEADNNPRRGYHSLPSSFGKMFHVEKRWKIIREMGSGAYGFVVSAADEITGEVVAIKLVTRATERIQLAKRALREITLLRHFAHHDNITGLIDVDAPSPELTEIYIFMEPMEADMHQIIKSGQALSTEHVQYFVYQILRGMKYIHSASVVHRDIKPGNILVNADCELKICDFGLSRGFDSTPETATVMTEYVATRWYRAPEIMLVFKRYDTAIDVWSIGCIFAELMLGRPLFRGKDYVDQLNKIIDVLGTPSVATIKRIGSEKAQSYLRSLPIRKTQSFKKLFPTANDEALDLLTKLISFDPAERITVKEALDHPWLSTYHNADDEPECATVFERWREIEKLETLEEFRKALWEEIQDHRRVVRRLDSSILPPINLNTVESLGLGQITEEPRETSRSLSPTDEPPVERVDQVDGAETTIRKDSLAPLPSDTRSVRSTTPTDPMATYRDARRSSSMQLPTSSAASLSSGIPPPTTTATRKKIPSFSEYYTAEDPASYGHGRNRNTIAFPSETFVVPARSRTSSLYGGEHTAPRRLLRTLSTVSIHESGEGLAGGLADIAPIGKYIVAKNTEDDPASEMPREFGDEGGQTKKGFHIP